MPYTRLNAAALTDQDALIISLISDAVPTFRTLVDSGSEDQFMDIQFAEKHLLPQKNPTTTAPTSALRRLKSRHHNQLRDDPRSVPVQNQDDH